MLLLHENTVVGEFSVITDEIRLAGYPRPPIGKTTVSSLLTWLASRVSPYAISDKLGLPYYGVSFTDNFWICEVTEPMFFEDINAFSHANIPQNQSCIATNGCFSIVKNYTPNEYYAFHVAQIIGLETVQYYPFNRYLLSPILSRLNESWFSVSDLRCYEEVLKRFPKEISNMIMFDALVGNNGRRLSNVSVICEPCSQRIKRLAPTHSLSSTFHPVEEVLSVWSSDLEQRVKEIRGEVSVKPSNLLPHLSKFPPRMQHILYHNLIQLNLI